MKLKTSDSFLFLNTTEYGFRAMLRELVKCACGRMTVFVVNRDGATRCLDCDEKYLKSDQNPRSDQVA